MLANISGFINRIDPLAVAAWVGFTITYKGGIDSAQAFSDWLTSAGAEATGALADFALWWASGVGQFAEIFTGEEVPIPGAEGFFQLKLKEGIGGFFEGIGKFLFPMGEISEWFWAAIAGAISVLALKRGLTP